MSGKVKGPDYDTEFRGLIHQYKMCVESIPNFDGIDRFIQEFNLGHCQSALRRIKEGKSGYKGEESDKNLVQRVFDITQKMINAFDILSINIDSVDEIAPAIRDIHQALSQYPNLPANYEGLSLMEKWTGVLN